MDLFVLKLHLHIQKIYPYLLDLNKCLRNTMVNGFWNNIFSISFSTSKRLFSFRKNHKIIPFVTIITGLPLESLMAFIYFIQCRFEVCADFHKSFQCKLSFSIIRIHFNSFLELSMDHQAFFKCKILPTTCWDTWRKWIKFISSFHFVYSFIRFSDQRKEKCIPFMCLRITRFLAQ